jgi:hypothetical protein
MEEVSTKISFLSIQAGKIGPELFFRARTFHLIMIHLFFQYDPERGSLIDDGRFYKDLPGMIVFNDPA